MDETTEESQAESAAPAELEPTSNRQSDKDIEVLKWQARAYLLAGLVPGGVLWGFIIGKGQSGELLANMVIALASLFVALPLLALAMIYAHRYSKATGKWWWI